MAVIATLISVGVAVLVALQRSDALTERLIFGGVGCLAVFGTHFLLPLARRRTRWASGVGSAIWALCAIYIAYGHTGYFLAVQEQSGLRRVEAFESSTAPTRTPNRELSQILTDLAKVKSALTALPLATCQPDCAPVSAKAAWLNGRVQALEAEVQEVETWRSDQAEHKAHMDAIQNDAVTKRLSKVFGLSDSVISLITATLFAALLETVACYCWFLLLTPRDSPVTTLTAEVTPAKTVPISSDLDSDVAKVRAEVDRGELNCTVEAIRKFLGCAQSHAAKVRRIVAS